MKFVSRLAGAACGDNYLTDRLEASDKLSKLRKPALLTLVGRNQ